MLDPTNSPYSLLKPDIPMQFPSIYFSSSTAYSILLTVFECLLVVDEKEEERGNLYSLAGSSSWLRGTVLSVLLLFSLEWMMKRIRDCSTDLTASIQLLAFLFGFHREAL